MIEFISKWTGTPMFVAEDRAERYKAAGHVPVADISAKEAEEPKPVADISAKEAEESKMVQKKKIRKKSEA